MMYRVVLVSFVCMLSACATNKETPQPKNQFVFDNSGVQLMRKNKDLVGPWTSYTLISSSCSRKTNNVPSYSCEKLSRDMMVTSWIDIKKSNPQTSDKYLDDVVQIYNRGFLDAYVWTYFHKDFWKNEEPSNLEEYGEWEAANLPNHIPETHVLGSYQ